MDLSNLINTIVLVNLRQDISLHNLFNILVGIGLVYVIKNYKVIYTNFLEIYENGTSSKKSIKLKMIYTKLSDIVTTSNKIIGLIYKINSMKLDVKQYKEVVIDVELIETPNPFYNVNKSQLIPILHNCKIDKDMFITISIKEESMENKTDEEKIK